MNINWRTNAPEKNLFATKNMVIDLTNRLSNLSRIVRHSVPYKSVRDRHFDANRYDFDTFKIDTFFDCSLLYY